MQSGFVEELKWRGMLFDATPGVEDKLASGMCTGYIGFDPTAKSLTIGNYVQVMLLSLFQKAGHRPIVLMGGATGRIGDPSGKDAERELKSYDELDANLKRQMQQFQKLLNFDDSGTNSTLMLNNLDFYKDMNAIEFLRIVGKNLTVNYMLSKESVKTRLETGISFTEFSYQLLQAYDYLHLYRAYDCSIQMGGSDQWGNITSGIEFVRRNEPGGKAFAITTPLLTKADGSKFGKSESGNVWLDPEMTSPYQFYQFWINADDRDISRFLRYFSMKSHEEIEALEKQVNTDPSAVKRILGEELTIRVHSAEAYDSTVQVSQMLFNPRLNAEDLSSFSLDAVKMIEGEIKSFQVSADDLKTNPGVIELLCDHTTVCSSRGDARRAIQSNAVAINKVKVASMEERVDASQFLHDKYLILENGKKNKYVVCLID
jgi:tyrosyl-tRNA synthetase